MKTILALIGIVSLIACATPYQITETITKDSTGKETHVITKTYSNGQSVVVPQASVNIATSPFFLFGTPYYRPYYYSPRVVVPVHPTPHYMPRGGRH